MSKKRLVTWLACFTLSLIAVGGLVACGDPSDSSSASEETSVSETPGTSETPGDEHTHAYISHGAVEADCENGGNDAYFTCEGCDVIFDADKNVINAIPTIDALNHDYEYVEEVAGNCSVAGTIAHYTCKNGCGKLFDLEHNEIMSVEGELDAANHLSAVQLAVIEQPTKTAYKVGEVFDPTNMYLAYNCADCEGDILDNQYLTYTYENGGNSFAFGDTKVTVNYNGLFLDIAVTVEKAQAEISGVQATYETTCGVAPVIEATSNYPDEQIVITYFDGETEVDASAFVSGKTYVAKVSIATTDSMLGDEKTAEITVAHKYEWKSADEDWKKLLCTCACGNQKDVYALDYQSPYVDADNLSIDLSKLIVGGEDVSVKSIKQIVRMNGETYREAKDGEVVDIEYTNDGFIYSFAADKYEQPSGEWKPYILTLAIVYDVDGMECPIVVEAKFVDKVIKSAEDLTLLAYTGAATTNDGGTENTGYYVLADDIDVSGISIPDSKVAWEEGLGFRGVLEGNGHTISGLTIGAWKNGLFGALGLNAKIQNVNFTDVSMGEGSYMFALVMRKTQLINVNIEFSVDTQSALIADTMNACAFNNVTVKTCVGAYLFWKIDDAETTEIPAGLTRNYYAQHTVTFNTDGGDAIAPVAVTVGKTVVKPTNPTKASDENYDYTFAGWFYKGEEFNFDTPITEAIELVAQWTATERLNETELITAATEAITALPESVTMPADLRYLSAISNANALYNQLSDEGKAQVSNASKLETLLAASKGYTAIYTPDKDGIKAIPAVMHNNNASVGATGVLATDAAQGTVFVSTAGENGKAAIQFVNFPSVVGYDKIYFYVRSDVSGYLYMSDDTANDGWGTNWANNSGSITQYPITKDTWTLMSLDVSTNIISGDWAISVWNTDIINKTLEIGVIVGCKTSDVPVAEKLEVTLDFGLKTDSGETNAYGKIYDISREQYYIDTNNTGTMGTLQTSKLANALPSGYDHFEFWVYNPTETDQTFHLAGDVSGSWTDSVDFTTLTAKSWTKVTISNADIQLNAQGQWYVYIGNADAAGWQISSIYAVKA